MCLCVGVANHVDPRICTLNGARVDAELVFSALTDPDKGGYDPIISRLLIDPSQDQLVASFADLTYGHDVDTFTFFFAGHGGQGRGSYCLLCSDTDLDRFIVSALPIARIFQLLSDARPRHVNLIIDACEAAGMVGDLSSLLKPSQIGQASTFSVSVFALSASDRSAGEDDEGGFGTTQLLKCINGETDCLVRKDFLSLDDIGNAVAPELEDQSPSIWSFNVSGASRFVRNPFTTDSDNAATVPAPSFVTDSLNAVDPTKLDKLWQTYLDLPAALNPRALQNELTKTLEQAQLDEQKAAILMGLHESFSARADQSEDAFDIVLTQCIFLFVAQKIDCTTVRSPLCEYILDQIDSRLADTISEINDMLETPFAMLSRGGAYAEFFCLPIRISKVFSWSLVSIFLSELRGRNHSDRVEVALSVFDRVFHQYQPSFSAISEEQSPFLFVISELGRRYGFDEFSESYISHMYSDFFFFGQRVAKTRMPEKEVFEFLRYRCERQNIDYRRFSAKPTELLFILFHHFLTSNRAEIVRYDLQELDQVHVNTFVSDGYSDFSDEMILNGSNIGFTIGFDVFTMTEFAEFYGDHLLPSIRAASQDLTATDAATSLLASLVYPDRTPWFLVHILERDLQISDQCNRDKGH